MLLCCLTQPTPLHSTLAIRARKLKRTRFFSLYLPRAVLSQKRFFFTDHPDRLGVEKGPRRSRQTTPPHAGNPSSPRPRPMAGPHGDARLEAAAGRRRRRGNWAAAAGEAGADVGRSALAAKGPGEKEEGRRGTTGRKPNENNNSNNKKQRLLRQTVLTYIRATCFFAAHRRNNSGDRHCNATCSNYSTQHLQGSGSLYNLKRTNETGSKPYENKMQRLRRTVTYVPVRTCVLTCSYMITEFFFVAIFSHFFFLFFFLRGRHRKLMSDFFFRNGGMLCVGVVGCT